MSLPIHPAYLGKGEIVEPIRQRRRPSASIQQRGPFSTYGPRFENELGASVPTLFLPRTSDPDRELVRHIGEEGAFSVSISGLESGVSGDSAQRLIMLGARLMVDALQETGQLKSYEVDAAAAIRSVTSTLAEANKSFEVHNA